MMKKRIFKACVVISLVATASACNTVKGFGEDVSSVGRAGEKAID